MYGRQRIMYPATVLADGRLYALSSLTLRQTSATEEREALRPFPLAPLLVDPTGGLSYAERCALRLVYLVSQK